MSEKFGLDWRDYEASRMMTFLEIASLESEVEKAKANKLKNGRR